MTENLSPPLLFLVDAPDAFLQGTWKMIKWACGHVMQHFWSPGYMDRRLRIEPAFSEAWNEHGDVIDVNGPHIRFMHHDMTVAAVWISQDKERPMICHFHTPHWKSWEMRDTRLAKAVESVVYLAPQPDPAQFQGVLAMMRLASAVFAHFPVHE